MRKTVIIALTLFAASCAQQQQDAAALLRDKGSPAFTAELAELRDGRLVCQGLAPSDASAVDAEKLSGKALIFCGPDEALRLWAASEHQKMIRATPVGSPLRPSLEPSRLPKAARISVVWLNDRGVVNRRGDGTVEEFQTKW